MGGQLISPREFIFGIFAAGLIGIACYALIGYFAAPFIGRMIAILPTQYLYPFIFMTAVAASYSSRASIWDVGFALLFGIIGYAMRRTNFSAAAFCAAAFSAALHCASEAVAGKPSFCRRAAACR